MKDWLKRFFNVSNEINENVVMGVLFAGLFIAATFLKIIPVDKYYVLAGTLCLFFGLGSLKK